MERDVFIDNAKDLVGPELWPSARKTFLNYEKHFSTDVADMICTAAEKNLLKETLYSLDQYHRRVTGDFKWNIKEDSFEGSDPYQRIRAFFLDEVYNRILGMNFIAAKEE